MSNPPIFAARIALGLAVIGVLGSCSEPVARPAPAAAPPPRLVAQAVLPPAPPPPADWHDAPFTPGDWQWQPGEARFGTHGAALFSLRCEKSAGRVRLVRHGMAAAPGALDLATTSLSRPLPAQPLEGGDGVAADLAAGDPLLDAMAFSRGRFAIEASGAAPLVLPAWPEVARVVEDCRAP